MNYHIVRTNEKIEDISVLYNIDIYEIKECNKHIRVWTNLTPGLKIRLPEISESLSVELNDVEPFIEDYYPTLSPLYKEEIINEIETINLPKDPIKKDTIEIKNNPNKNFYYYPYYNPYYMYYRNYFKNRKPK